MHYIHYAEIVDAIHRANMVEHYAENGDSIGFWPENCDGTYEIVPTWIGSARVWMAQRLRETSGYEVAYAEVLGRESSDLDSIEPHTRIGYWRDPADGTVYLDHTMHIRGTRAGVALDVARLYNQKAIWCWHDANVIETTDPATAL